MAEALKEARRLWLEIHGPSYLWCLAARRFGLWYAIRFVRARQATEPELAPPGVPPDAPAWATVSRRQVRYRPWWLPRWAWQAWNPEPRSTRHG